MYLVFTKTLQNNNIPDEEYVYQLYFLEEINTSPFTLSCWVKTENLNGGFQIGVHLLSIGHQKLITSNPITGTNNWQKISLTIDDSNMPEWEVEALKVMLIKLSGSGKV